MLKGGLAVLVFWLIIINAIMWCCYLDVTEQEIDWGLALFVGTFTLFSWLIYDMWRD
jgi:hypothetical protein